MEIKMEKTRKKVPFYDKMNLNESTLAIFIVMGLFLTALAMGLGYFSGNDGEDPIPVVGSRQDESESAVFVEDDGRQKPEHQTERLEENNRV